MYSLRMLLVLSVLLLRFYSLSSYVSSPLLSTLSTVIFPLLSFPSMVLLLLLSLPPSLVPLPLPPTTVPLRVCGFTRLKPSMSSSLIGDSSPFLRALGFFGSLCLRCSFRSAGGFRYCSLPLPLLF